MFTLHEVTLRPLEPEDVPTLYSWHQDYRLDLLAGWEPKLSRAAFQDKWNRRVTETRDDLLLFGIQVQERLVGTVMLGLIDREQRRSALGIVIGEQALRRRGIGKKAVQLMLDYGFSVLSLEKIYAEVYGFNEPSRRLMESAGFTLEGILRQHERHNGARHDMVQYGMLVSEFQARYPSLFTLSDFSQTVAVALPLSEESSSSASLSLFENAFENGAQETEEKKSAANEATAEDAIMDFRGDYAFLSNFSKSPLLFEGETYPTVEHAFQAAKTDSLEERAELRRTASPVIVKRKGRKVTLRADWEEVKREVMRELLLRKFQQPDLRDRLLATGDRELVEGNGWHDNFWGACTCAKCSGKGRNELGQLLMEVRDELRPSV